MEARSCWFVRPRAVELRHDGVPDLRPGQVRVRTSFSGISGGTEMLAYRGELDPDLAVDESIGALGGTFTYPFRYGYSCVGVVEESRADVPAGALVFSFQPHQDVFVAGADAVVELGDVDARQATLFPLVETALQISIDAAPHTGEPIVVFGLGAVGLLTAVLLRRAGARVFAVEVTPWRRQVAASVGIEAVDPALLAAALEAAGHSGGVPVAVEVTGNPAALEQALGVLAHEGEALVASWFGTKPVTLPLGADFHRRRLTIRSTQVSTIPARLSHRWDADRRRRVTLDLLGELPLAELATHTFAFERASDAYAAIDSGEVGLMHAALGYT